MDLPAPPETDDIRIMRQWLTMLYQWLKYPPELHAQYFELQELTADAPAPGVNRTRVYAKDNGSSKTALYARFNTGAVQQIAVEP